jgi:acyl carrier protein
VNPTDARDTVLELLAQIAPEADLATLPDDADLREAVDLDSLDFLTLVERLAERTGVDVPENDYPEVRTLGGLTGYVVRRTTS